MDFNEFNQNYENNSNITNQNTIINDINDQKTYEHGYRTNIQASQFNNVEEFIQQPIQNDQIQAEQLESLFSLNPEQFLQQHIYHNQPQSSYQQSSYSESPSVGQRVDSTQNQFLYNNYNHTNLPFSLPTNYSTPVQYNTHQSSNQGNHIDYDSNFQIQHNFNQETEILPFYQSSRQTFPNIQIPDRPSTEPKNVNFTNEKLSSDTPRSSTKSTTTLKSSSSRSCDTCRNKKLKCDKQKPTCSRCKEKGINCVYTLKLQFKEDVESQGKRFGREGINSSNKITTTEFNKRSKKSYYQIIQNQNQLKFINFFNNDILNINQKIKPILNNSIIPSDILSLDLDSSLDSNVISFAISYYIEFISPILNPTSNNKSITLPTKENDVNNISIESGLNLNSLVQLSNQNNSIFYFMLSLGSLYLSRTFNEIENKQQKQIWIDRAFQFQSLGLIEIKPILNDINDLKGYKTSDIIISLVLLILFEIANNCNFKWIEYLQICKKIMKLNKINIPQNSNEFNLLKFSLEFLYYHDSVGRTACKDDTLYIVQLDDEIEEEEFNNNFFDKQTESKSNNSNLISWMGCDKKLIKIIANITDLSFERFKRNINEKQYLNFCNELIYKIDLLKIDYFEFNELITENDDENISQINQLISNNGIKEEEFFFLLSNEIKRLSTKLYLNCCLLNMTPEDEEVSDLVNIIYKYLNFLLTTTTTANTYNWFSTLLWSIFITSTEISVLSKNCESYRYLSLKFLKILTTKSLSNIERTIEIIKKIWKKRDLNNSDLHSVGIIDINSRKFKKRKKFLGFENDWEKFVVDEYGIALG
ncbi:uncharacterized protein KGF55_001645 [Candida pseudojiufengensis]|uniref:uncharacterized protein n=1 Tax=Candida pseudojiufengensis TaxID=497109 RepID=UPI0022251ACF|nr:uncharacterized protein KGF55_001645 [Candida pseudojiufengensis]KAI5964576.1 hypothetical protein KGF55_001645 [Candida pseudojiufengensis]